MSTIDPNILAKKRRDNPIDPAGIVTTPPPLS